MTDMTIPEALDKLATEGDADRIATYLREQGYLGELSARACPVALYLNAVTSTEASVGINSRHRVEVHGTVNGEVQRGVAAPSVVNEFVRRYDLGMYPDLKVATDD